MVEFNSNNKQLKQLFNKLVKQIKIMNKCKINNCKTH